MAIHYKNGDLLKSNAQYICQQVNCQGVMGSGLAKQIRAKYPIVYTEYRRWYEWADETCTQSAPPELACVADAADVLLGNNCYIKINDSQEIVCMAAQDRYGRDPDDRYTSYDAFWECLQHLRRAAPKGSTIAFPYKIGCGLGNGNWDVIRAMISTLLGRDYEVYIYEYRE